MHATTSNSVFPGRGSLRFVERTLAEIARVHVPRLQSLCQELRRELTAADAAPLVDALTEHHAAASALGFDLLIPRGLRAAVSRGEAAAFHGQVQRLVDATALTWGELRSFLGASAGSAAGADVLLSEFVMQARAVQRGAGACAEPLARARQAARAAAPAGWPVAPAGHAEFVARLEAMAARCDALEAACDAARRVRRLAQELAQDRAGAHAALNEVARSLGGGLLERLRLVLARTGAMAVDEIAVAQEARGDLRALLLGAVGRLHGLAAIRLQLLDALDAMNPLLQKGR